MEMFKVSIVKGVGKQIQTNHCEFQPTTVDQHFTLWEFHHQVYVFCGTGLTTVSPEGPCGGTASV